MCSASQRYRLLAGAPSPPPGQGQTAPSGWALFRGLGAAEASGCAWGRWSPPTRPAQLRLLAKSCGLFPHHPRRCVVLAAKPSGDLKSWGATKSVSPARRIWGEAGLEWRFQSHCGRGGFFFSFCLFAWFTNIHQYLVFWGLLLWQGKEKLNYI